MHISRRDFLHWSGLGLGAAALAPLVPACTGDDPAERPWWVSGNYAPVADEIEAFDLSVTGAIPPELDGLYLRNGPNPPSGTSLNWFFGDGMAHGVWLSGGKALAYRNRWVGTGFHERGGSFEDGADLTANFSNTAYVHHAGVLLSLYEGGRPYQLSTDDLSTMGGTSYGFDGKLLGPMTAHPKVDPDTGEMHFFGYGPFEPYLEYHHIDAAGVLTRSVPIEIPRPTMQHDFQVTRSHVVFMDLPVLFELEAATAGGFPFRWDPSAGARFGVLPIGGASTDVRWFDIDPCYVFHTINAFDDGDDAIVVSGARHPYIWRDGPEDQSAFPALHRWRIDLESGAVTETRLDDQLVDFPRVDPRLRGRRSRYGYALRFRDLGIEDVLNPGDAVVKYDTDDGTAWVYEYGDRYQPDEHVFAPTGAGEDEGYLLGFVYDRAEDTSDLVILDATNVAAGPVARVHMPRRVPFGFHGEWVPAV